MELNKIGFKPVVFVSPKNNSRHSQEQNTQNQRKLYPMPDYRHYISFKGGKSLDLKQTMTELLKPEECPPGVWERAQEVLAEGNPENKTLIDIHKEVYDDLNYVSNVEELREFFPQFKDVKSTFDVKPVANSFLDDVKNGRLEHFNQKNDTSLDLVHLLYAEGFSTNDLLQYTNNKNITGTIKGLGIPLLQPHYAQVLKLSDREFNERITKAISQNRFENADRKAQKGEPVYIPSTRKGKPLSPEHRHKISESLVLYYAENPERINEQSERQKAYFRENPDQAELLSLVSTRAWKDSPSVRKALSRHFRKYGANAINEKNFNGIDLEPNQKTLMKSFWDKNAWAREKFSKSMKEAYCLIYSEDKKTHTIKMYPDEMVQETIRLSKADGVEYGPEDFQTIYKRRSSEEVIQLDPKGFGAIEKYVFDDEKKSNVMSDTWGQTIADLGKYLREKIRDDKTEKGEKILYGSILNYSTKQVIESLKQKRYNEEGQEVEPYATASELYRIYAMTYALCIDLKLRDCTEFMKEKLEENYSKFKDNPTYKEVVKES